MVYGRYNYSFHGVYKPTNITGGHHPATSIISIHYSHVLKFADISTLKSSRSKEFQGLVLNVATRDRSSLVGMLKPVLYALVAQVAWVPRHATSGIRQPNNGGK